MKPKYKKGNWVFIIGSRMIRQDYFDKNYPKGIFGRIIDVNQRYSQFNGEKLPLQILVRAYTRNGITHLKTEPKFLTTSIL